MTARDFCYWLQGMFELTDVTALDVKQTDLVKRHLAMVFQHDIDPSMGGPAQQAALQQIHAGLAGAQLAQTTQDVKHFTGYPDGPGGVKYRC